MLTREQWWSATTQITYSVSGTEINKDDKWWSCFSVSETKCDVWKTKTIDQTELVPKHTRPLVHLFNRSSTQVSDQPITRQELRAFRHMDQSVSETADVLGVSHTAISEFTENVRKGPVRGSSLGDNRQSASSWERGNRNSNDQPQYADPQVPHLPAVNNKLKPLNDNRRWKNAAWSEAQFLLPQSNGMKAWILPISGWWRRDGERELWIPPEHVTLNLTGSSPVCAQHQLPWWSNRY